jgi:hypothetical protein
LQFPLSDPSDCALYCGGQCAVYEEGYTIIDDAYLHYAENKRQKSTNEKFRRIMLVIDLPHPNITLDERKQIAALLDEFKKKMSK